MLNARMPTSSPAPVSFAGAVLTRSRHVCAFFNSRDEEYRVLLPFIKEGVDRGERAFHITDPALKDDHLERMRHAGVDVAETQRRGQLEVLVWQEAYLRNGHF